ncbi:unnamed protein product [Eruca vesicaria subsp. sativa]|uniref:F-box domain-containing protein n=1 Tax=Eruca vesicaria subsp. sativa TaxID=29727 RepID=A0ABC8K2L8_ERUVS|nr:unnamed protein product [Eruca vesicaria subsp. sativa]
MGSVMSLSCPKTKGEEELSNESCETRKTCPSNDQDYSRLIPNLPDELSLQILAMLPRICYSNVQLVSRRWRSALSTPELFTLRKELGRTEEWLYLLTKSQEGNLSLHALDPVSTRWQRLPPMPVIVYEDEPTTSSMWNLVRSLLGRKAEASEFESEQMPFCGSAIGSIDGCLYILGGLSRSKTVNSVWRFDPVLNSWSEVSTMLANRAYSRTGVLDKKLYVVGGVESRRGSLYPVQTAEVYDPETDVWSEVPNIPFSKAQVLPNEFLADLLKPIVTGMTCYNGRLCVTQSLYSCPFFFDAGGKVYDPERSLWGEMPSGMGQGWPAKGAGTKLSVVVGGELYCFDPSSSSLVESGKIKVYDQKEDVWRVVIGEVPVYDMTDSKSSFLLAGFHGKLHFITRDFDCNVTVLRADVNEIQGSSSSSLSSSKAVLGSCSLKEKGNVDNKSDSVLWTAIASKDLGAAELVSCQVIDI